ncbi:MAG TPA: hypothetical protein VEK74_10250 [Burkholderiaceae bacterium]|nr:hypothetical protein [Burkholderiaceae bacterium]HYA75536.1 hypothetical protein [Burkholderiaceae bacterium]
MKLQRCLAPALALCLTTGLTAARAVDVGVSVQFAQPGAYGRVDIGRYPQPQVIVSTPVIAEPPPAPPPVPEQPMYLWVPPEHQAHWREHCHEYHACGHPVYFVHHDWYREHVLAERHREERREERRGEERDRRDYERERGRD